MSFKNFSLILPELKESVCGENFLYFLTAIQDSILESPLAPSEVDSGTLKGEINGFNPLKREETGFISHHHINLSSLKRSQRTPSQNDISCSQLPVCRRIISKIALKTSTAGPSRSSSLSLERAKPKTYETENLTQLIGKISYPALCPPAPAVRKNNKGVLDLRHSISNPLYKTYNPKGFVKSEDEEVREFIERIANLFNSWLATIDGDPVQVESQTLIRILREELEVPDPLELRNIELILSNYRI